MDTVNDTIEYLYDQYLAKGWTMRKTDDGFTASRQRRVGGPITEVHVGRGGWNGQHLTARKLTVEAASKVSDEILGWSEA